MRRRRGEGGERRRKERKATRGRASLRGSPLERNDKRDRPEKGRGPMHPFASSSLMVMIAFRKSCSGNSRKRKHRDLYSGRDMGLLPWRGSRGSSQVGVDSRNKLLKKGEERERRVRRGGRGGSSSRLLRSSSASDNKSELRPRTR